MYSVNSNNLGKPCSPNVKNDSTDFINKIQALIKKGPLPAGSLPVSWDVVSVFPNINNNLGITAVRKALIILDLTISFH